MGSALLDQFDERHAYGGGLAADYCRSGPRAQVSPRQLNFDFVRTAALALIVRYRDRRATLLISRFLALRPRIAGDMLRIDKDACW